MQNALKGIAIKGIASPMAGSQADHLSSLLSPANFAGLRGHWLGDGTRRTGFLAAIFAELIADAFMMGSPNRLQPYQQLANMALSFDLPPGQPQSYRCSLDLSEAIARTEFEKTLNNLGDV